MKKNTPSKTAELAALVRSSVEHIPFMNPIMQDHYAKFFVSRRTIIQSIYYRHFKNMRKMENWSNGLLSIACLFPLCRHRFFNNLQTDGIKQKFEQIIILGAGYDTSSMRLYSDHTAVRLFEIDHPATQDRKLKIIKKYDLPCHESVSYIPCDVSKDDFVSKLIKKKFDPSKKTLLIAEGLLSYLDRESINNLLSNIKRVSVHTVCAFDYRFPNLSTMNTRGIINSWLNIFKKAGEGYGSFYSLEEMGNLLTSNSFIIKNNVNLVNIWKEIASGIAVPANLENIAGLVVFENEAKTSIEVAKSA